MNDSGSCTGCRLCYRECRVQADAIWFDQGTVRVDTERCNRCGHCVAVCPTGAMAHPLVAPQEQIGPLPSPEQALHFLRTPRSVRFYRQELVPKETLCRLLEAGRYPQTVKNTQGIHYRVVRGREKVEAIHHLYREIVQALPSSFPHYDILIRPVIAEDEKGFDALFYQCPQLIFATCQKGSPTGPRNAQFSLTFLSLMAPSLGLGTCWSGQLERLACQKEFMPRFAALIGLPDEEDICGCMMVGYPAVQFRRLVERDPLQVSWCET